MLIEFFAPRDSLVHGFVEDGRQVTAIAAEATKKAE